MWPPRSSTTPAASVRSSPGQVVVMTGSAAVSVISASTVYPQQHSGAFSAAGQPRSGTSDANPLGAVGLVFWLDFCVPVDGEAGN
jgi:hypothetical protein